MAVIKCKMCGGELELIPGSTVAECEYCGSLQTVPNADNEKKLTLFSRANRLRIANEFDKAAGIYESIVADFPEEAEAYWGLVLCKYGIEYVDDPATGKKIPTCHRSSFESVMDDPNFEQALENADVVARKVYRDEAKALEEIRKGIIEVSAKEEPYDVFICYKESAADGQRTLDSVLAQDIYDALTAKDYRVFFARISLEDKIGQEYEPFIFAALNSAKIMLAVGTDYEYYNAVWVKNEWSRFLKLMEKDKQKHLIPCFKGIDAYDMPKEFNRLQAQDLGKVGAMQDLLRGIEKLLPKAKPVTQQVVVNTGYASNVTALLKRGQMALEDGQWVKAEDFYEDVLNHDAECAEAYLGKTLVLEKCASLQKLADQRLASTQTPHPVKKEILKDNCRITDVSRLYALPGYLEKPAIEKLFQYPDYTYPSYIASREKQLAEEKKFWEGDRNISRAFQFAQGDFKTALTAARDRVLAAMEERVQKAKESELAAKESKLKNYADFLNTAEEKAKALNTEAQAKKKAHYETQADIANNSQDIQALRGAERALKQLGEYEHSRELARLCMEKIAKLQAEADRLAAEAKAKAEAEAAAKAKAEAEAKAKAKKKAITTGAITAAVIAVIVVVALVLTNVIIPNGKLSDAEELLAAGEYQQAYDKLADLGEYKNSAELLAQIAQHGRYAPTSLYLDNADADYDDYNITITYNSHGLPAIYDSVKSDFEAGADRIPTYRFSYTWYESGNLESCTVLRDNNIPTHTITFYDVPGATVQYAYSRVFSEEYISGFVRSNFRYLGMSQVQTYDSDGEPDKVYSYSPEGFPESWTCTFDDAGNLISYYGNDSHSVTNLTYNEKGDIATRTYVWDRNEPDRLSDDDYEYSYQYSGNQLTSWSFKEDFRDINEVQEDYTYDEAGNIKTLVLSTRYDPNVGDDRLKEKLDYTLTWEWLDYESLAAVEAEAEAVLEKSYADALALLESGDAEGAYNAFQALGDYKDSQEQMNVASEALVVPYINRIEEAMKTSFAKAYPLFEEEIPYENDRLAELREIVETYYPYCGHFEFDADGVESDFRWDGKDVWWLPKTDSSYTFCVRIDKTTYIFFQEPVIVENMKVIDEQNSERATVRFEDGKMTYELGYYSSVTYDENNVITKKDDYKTLFTQESK